MERYFILDSHNTWYDFHCIVTAKKISDPEPKTNYVKLDGMHGSLDLSESLTGDIHYDDRTISMTLWTDYGNRKDRESLLQRITNFLHGQRVTIIEPDDPDHYFNGRAKIKSKKNTSAYAEVVIEAVCEPWRYARAETVREVEIGTAGAIDVVINNGGVKILSPTITVDGSVEIGDSSQRIQLDSGAYFIPDIKLRRGVNIIRVSGNGSVKFSYREAYL